MLRVSEVVRNVYLSLGRRQAPSGQTTQGQLTPLRTIPGHTNTVWAVAFFKDGRRAVTGSTDCVLKVWDMQTGVLVEGPFEGHKEGVLSVAVSPDDRRIISAGWDKTVMIWDVERKYMSITLAQHTATVNSVCFSPDGKKFASGSDDETVVLWDGDTCDVLAILHHSGHVCSVAFSPDNLRLATGSGDSIIRVWHTKNAEVLLKINAHRWSIRSIAWLPDGQQLVSASSDRTVKFWNLSNGSQIGQPCIGHTDVIVSLAVSSDGSFIATASDDKTVRLWSTETYQQIGQSLEHTAWVPFVAICPNMELLVSATDAKVLLWSIEALSAKIVPRLSKQPAQKLDDAPDLQIPQLPHQYTDPSETDRAIREAIHHQLENAPLRLFNTFTGRLCNQEAQTEDFLRSIEYKELSSSMARAPLQMEPIREVVVKYFSWVMLSHRWEQKESLLHDIQDKVVYDLDPVGTMVKLQTFCKTARDAGYRWAWCDTCCIDQNNNLELQRSVNLMFDWYRQSALTIVYLSDVSPTAKSGALAKSAWITRGWTIQEFLAPLVVLFYQADWTPYLDDRSSNHKKSAIIMNELQNSTGIDALSLVTFRPGMKGAREKLQWASSRVTTLQEDVAYSLFGIFDINLPILYGERKQNALGRLLQEIVNRSGDITALDWVGKSSEFNSCFPADIAWYRAPPCILPSLPEDEMQSSVSKLQNTITVESASALYTHLYNLPASRFARSRLHLPCIAFPVTEVRRIRGQEQGTSFTYYVRADGLQDLAITTENTLVQFSQARPTQQAFLLVRPWSRFDPGLPDFEDDEVIKTMSMPLSMSDRSISGSHEEYEESVDLELPSRAFRLMVRLGQPFGALLLAQQRSGEYKRIASDHDIVARVKDMSTAYDMTNIRTVEIV